LSRTVLAVVQREQFWRVKRVIRQVWDTVDLVAMLDSAILVINGDCQVSNVDVEIVKEIYVHKK
jgi:hypothetical protein